MSTRESTLAIEATDVSRQKKFSLSDLEEEMTVGELVENLLEAMRMPAADTAGRPLAYHARLEREGRHLHASETVGEALESGDLLTLLPNIEAGRR
ncbi:MAG: hypothetical protein FJY73_07790 [Candidatus Eisenbacteria bacterium]|nr:hypothetical protein [Candidatus Eisenbacteria bacterium]